MKDNGNRIGEQFVPLPRSVIDSDAWRGLGLNARRFIDFLLREHMRKGGMANGSLLAPYRHLVEYGITMRLIRPSIEEAEAAGLVEAHRGGMRTATLYTLTWLPRADEQYRPTSRRRLKPAKRRNGSASEIQKSASSSGSK